MTVIETARFLIKITLKVISLSDTISTNLILILHVLLDIIWEAVALCANPLPKDLTLLKKEELNGGIYGGSG